jgi:hypothetical protein
MYWQPLSYSFVFSCFFWNTTYRSHFGGESETGCKKKQSVIELNLEDIHDYAGNYEDPFVTIFQTKKKCRFN